MSLETEGIEKYVECFRNEYLGVVHKRAIGSKVNALKREHFPNKIELIQANYLIIKNINKNIFKIIEGKIDYYFIILIPVKQLNLLLCVKDPIISNIHNLKGKMLREYTFDFPNFYLPKTIKVLDKSIIDLMIPRNIGDIIISKSNKQIFNIDEFIENETSKKTD
jgi:hypothetical protein